MSPPVSLDSSLSIPGSQASSFLGRFELTPPPSASTQIASPPSLQALPSLPWETVEHIYSFCDQETLVSLSLVSFGSWELAGPILYEKVEITTLDGLVFALLHREFELLLPLSSDLSVESASDELQVSSTK